jgi:rubrerythrin
MTQKKITKRESFTEIKELLEGLGKDRLAEVMEHELELLTKKNSADKKPTATQVENEKLKDLIVEFMVEGEKYTITDFIKSIPELNEKTNQKVSAIVKQMYADEDKGQKVWHFPLVRVEEKRKAVQFWFTYHIYSTH